MVFFYQFELGKADAADFRFGDQSFGMLEQIIIHARMCFMWNIRWKAFVPQQNDHVGMGKLICRNIFIGMVPGNFPVPGVSDIFEHAEPKAGHIFSDKMPGDKPGVFCWAG